MDLNSNSAAGSTPTASTRWDSSWPRWLSPAELEHVLDYHNRRFGIQAVNFASYRWWKTARKYGLIMKSACLDTVCSLTVYKVGLVALHQIGGYLKPTTCAIQLFGEKASKNVVELEREALLELLENRTIQRTPPAEPGYVIMTYKGDVLGCGLALEDKFMHQLPRWMVQAIVPELRMGGE